jgi:putative lipoprotein
MASVDGMCRPNQYNGFVFVGNRFAGTLAPQPTGARLDGALGEIRLFDPSNLTAEFARYTSTDPLCCPSQTSLVSYSISSGTRAVVSAEQVSTTAACPDEGGVETQDNVVSGTVTYRQRIALPDTAVLSVRLLDVTREDISAVTIAEQRIQTDGKQVPLSFDIVYEPEKIDPKNRYSVRAEIYDGGRLLFTTGANVPVITQGNPRVVDMVLVPVGGAGRDRGSGVIRGSVTYRERIVLPPNAEVNVSLVDAADPNGIPVAESTFETGGRQVPIPFELRYEPRNIVRGRNYELRAEIRTAGEPRFNTE